jgi:hypothetical protein
MRHLIGIVLAIVMAGVLFFAGAWGYLRLLGTSATATSLSGLPASGGSLISDHRVLYGLTAVAVTGLLAGILVTAPRISPLAAGLPGLLLVGWTGFYVLSVRHAIDLIPLTSHAAGAGFRAMLVNGIAGAAGLGMVIPLFVPSRWRSRASDESDSIVTEADDYVSDLTPPPTRTLHPTAVGGGGRPRGMPQPQPAPDYGAEG